METIELWDGRTYSTEEVERVSPKLLEYAKAYPGELESTIDQRHFAPLGARLKFLGAIWALLAVVFLFKDLALFLESLDPISDTNLNMTWDLRSLEFDCMMLGTVILVGVFGAVAAPRFARRHLPRTIRVRNGRVEMQIGQSVYHVAALEDVKWRNGWGHECGYRLRVLFAGVPCIVFVGCAQNLIAAISPEEHAVWEAFLRLSGTEQMRSTSKRLFILGLGGAMIGGFGAIWALNSLEPVSLSQSVGIYWIRFFAIPLGFALVGGGVGVLLGGSDFFWCLERTLSGITFFVAFAAGIALLVFDQVDAVFYLLCPISLAALFFIWTIARVTGVLRRRFRKRAGDVVGK